MSQLPEIPASAYTPEMETLGPIPDIPTFEAPPIAGHRIPSPLRDYPDARFSDRVASRNCSVEEQSRDATVHQQGKALDSCVDLGKARAGGSSTDASAFWDLLDPPMSARLVAADFGDYAAGLRRTQPRFPPAMRYALMERWNDCTHTFMFGFGEMMLTPVDYAAITDLRFAGPVAPLDARYQIATLGAQLAERIRTRLATWRELPVEARPAASAYTREERDQAARSFLFYIISSQLLCTSQNKGDQTVIVCLRDLGRVGSFNWTPLALAHLYHGLDVWTRGSGESNWQFIRPLEYRIYPGGPSGDTPTDSRRIPRYLAHCHHTYASTEDPEYWRSFLNDRALSDLFLTPWEGEAWRTYPGREAASAQRRVPHAPPRHMRLLEGLTVEDQEEEYEGSAADSFLSAGDYATYFSTGMQARLPEERKKHKTAAHYRAEATAAAAVNTQILRLKKPVFPDCKQSGRTRGHFGNLPEVCQYGT
ncbi:hypothetical protein JCGZ_19794 [Jatropha curcas]|uniref:Aminotransferase-like plant mobile domain-containing protein n=1 Tax=Jatropha curcas TaxID=180498 RepID=A0A067JVW3_JATCU|nr:hypothetical protein JCGZ_19794 [Jatropha curcas]